MHLQFQTENGSPYDFPGLPFPFSASIYIYRKPKRQTSLHFLKRKTESEVYFPWLANDK